MRRDGCLKSVAPLPQSRREPCHRGAENTEDGLVESGPSRRHLGPQNNLCVLCASVARLSVARGRPAPQNCHRSLLRYVATGGGRRWGREGERCTRLRFRVASIAVRHLTIAIIRVICNRQSAICNLQSSMHPSRWYRSFYWRIGISFLVLVVGVIVVQSVMFSAMMRSASMAPRAPHLRAIGDRGRSRVGAVEGSRLRRGGLPAPHPRRRSPADLRRQQRRWRQRQHRSAAGRRHATVGAGDDGRGGVWAPNRSAEVAPDRPGHHRARPGRRPTCARWSSCRRRRWASSLAKWDGCCRCPARWCCLRRPCWPPG